MAGQIGATILNFVRLLRRSGLPVGPAHALAAVEAAAAVGPERRDDLYWALHATLVRKREEKPIFDQAFHLFWRNPRLLEKMMGLLLPNLQLEGHGTPPPDLAARLAEAFSNQAPRETETEPEEREEISASLSASDREELRARDFESMTLAELEAAKAAMARLRLTFPPARSRRLKRDPRGGRFDGRATLRAAARSGGDLLLPKFARRRWQPTPIVVLCDISGSMERYARVLLHFLHGLAQDHGHVSAFVFGTRLTNITRALQHKDADEAVNAAAAAVLDWSGGTRIGEALERFNKDWARRVLGRGAIVLLITDGLERDDPALLAAEAARLRRSCRRLIWLNPLLRYEGFAPRAQGVRALLPNTDEMRPVHSLDSLAALADALTRPIPTRR